MLESPSSFTLRDVAMFVHHKYSRALVGSFDDFEVAEGSIFIPGEGPESIRSITGLSTALMKVSRNSSRLRARVNNDGYLKIFVLVGVSKRSR